MSTWSGAGELTADDEVIWIEAEMVPFF